MASQVKKYYQILTGQSYETFKKPTEKETTDSINKALINGRKSYLYITKEDKRFEAKLTHFNKVLKQKKIEEITDVIRYLVRSDNFMK